MKKIKYHLSYFKKPGIGLTVAACCAFPWALHGQSESLEDLLGDDAGAEASDAVEASNSDDHIVVSDAEVDEDFIAAVESMSLSELLNPEITSVSRHAEDLFKASAAAFVITNDDIRRSGARSIPEALRMAPGISVGQIDANKWAVTSRGFNDRFANKLLVLMDGRTIYTPTNSGVFWDAQNYLLEDIERIEVIRGPGGTMWGENAVNGVINIITKHSRETTGKYITGGIGSHERGFSGLRIGGGFGQTGYFRGYVNYFDRDDLSNGNDGYNNLQSGFRMDWGDAGTYMTLSGDAYHGRISQSQFITRYTPVDASGSFRERYDETFDSNGSNIRFALDHEIDVDQSFSLQAYYDYRERDEILFDSYRHTFDIEFQHRFTLFDNHNISWGGGWRVSPDKFRNPDPLFINWDPAETEHQRYSAFIQDEIDLSDTLRFTIGTKVEKNDYTGWEAQPNARIAYTPNDEHTVWGSVSRAVQVPQRNQEAISPILIPVEPALVPVDVNGDGIPDSSLPLFIFGYGNPDLEATELIAYELGYRVQPTENLGFDIAGFINQYSKFPSAISSGPDFGFDPVPHLAISSMSSATDYKRADTYGVEVASTWRVLDWWLIQSTYSFIHMNIEERGPTRSLFDEGKDPRHQASLRSSWDLPADIELDIWGRFVDQLNAFGYPSYFDLDIRLAWHPTENLEIAVVGQNLIDSNRNEFDASGAGTFIIPSEMERGVYGQITYRW